MIDIGDEVILNDHYGEVGWDELNHDAHIGKTLKVVSKNILQWFVVSFNGVKLHKPVNSTWLTKVNKSKDEDKAMVLRLDDFAVKSSSKGHCPLCGCNGRTSAVYFYCSNPSCNNYDEMFCVEELL